jgi:hypothetical protein
MNEIDYGANDCANWCNIPTGGFANGALSVKNRFVNRKFKMRRASGDPIKCVPVGGEDPFIDQPRFQVEVGAAGDDPTC